MALKNHNLSAFSKDNFLAFFKIVWSLWQSLLLHAFIIQINAYSSELFLPRANCRFLGFAYWVFFKGNSKFFPEKQFLGLLQIPREGIGGMVVKQIASWESSDMLTKGLLISRLADSSFRSQFRSKEQLAPKLIQFCLFCWKTQRHYFSWATAAFENFFGD